jgi:hypothetical protein
MRSFLLLACVILTVVAPVFVSAQDCATTVGVIRNCATYTRIDADANLLVAAELELPRVTVLDMSAPNAPVELGSYLAADQADDVAISGSIVLAAVAGQIDVISIADPRNPVRVGRLTTNGYYHRVTVDGTLAAALDEELQRYAIIDLTNPAAPAVTATLTNVSNAVSDLTLSGTLLLGAVGGIENINVANRAAPVRSPVLFPVPEIIYRNIAATRQVVVMEESFGEDIHVTKAQAPVITGGLSYDATVIDDVAVGGCRAYFISATELRTLDISACEASCGTCTPSETNVCLANGRFSVTASWSTATAQGVARRVTISDDTAGFWFFGPSNTEMLFKVLDGCGVNNRFWFFAGGLTDVEVTIAVRDTKTNAVRTYVNPRGRSFETITDTNAFVCP